MKTNFVTRNILVTTIILCLFVLLIVFKLNSYYKNEKSQVVVAQILQQNSNLKSSVSSQLNQLKNTLSGYVYQIEEAKLNWIQLDLINVLAQTQVLKNGQIVVKNIYTKAGSKSERWTKDFLQKALNLKKISNKLIHIELFQTKSGDKYIAMTFLQAGAGNGESLEALSVVAEANYFQKTFDLNRSRKITHVLMTESNMVAGHSESEYVATETAEKKIDKKKYFVETEDLRSTNLKIVSYSPVNTVVSLFNVPLMLMGLIIGFTCVVFGILFYAFRPIEKSLQVQKENERQQLYKKTLDENLQLTLKNRESEHGVIAPKAVFLSLNSIPTTAPPHQDIHLPTNFSFQDSAAEIHSQVSLSSIVDEVVFHMQHSFQQAGIHLSQDLKSELKFEVDPVRFKKLFQNVFKNAIEAVRDMQIKNIQIRTYDKNSTAFVEVQDSGSGVSVDELEKIWNPYYSTKEKSQHQGLGLPEAKSIAQRFGGDLRLIHAPSGGVIVQLVMEGKLMENKNEVEPSSINSTDLDLDHILDLDSEEKSDGIKPSFDLQKEFTTTQFKVDSRIHIIEDPNIEFKPSEKMLDQFKVHIRGPQKS